MRTLIVSDVHSNIEGFAAVVRDAERRGPVDAVWCIGDVVGYGPNPSEAIAAVRQPGVLVVAGNHDLAACRRMDTLDFNPVAAAAAHWTRDSLGEEDRAYLHGLPLIATAGAFTLVHGSLRHPEWEYLLDPEQAEAHFALQGTPFSVVGHSHVQFLCTEREGQPPLFHRAEDGERVPLGDERVILNPGSSGQPRDADPRAGYMLYDDASHTVSWHRVEYDARPTLRKIIEAGLPEYLGQRLLIGR